MSASREACTADWESSSSADVASSNRQILGLRRNTRAMAMRCRCPPLSLPPRSPTRVWYPSFISEMNSWACAFVAADTTCSMVYSWSSSP
mmetsp:Transcript_75500/g.147846  ORF Transcript_75500/g.147846 Transcript_75500/m.147846 type:complete len:90 (+) Transcript_75500:565-834(+)